MKIFVEGGGDGKDLKTKCRQGFSSFLQKAGFQGRMPAFVSCGGRQATFEDFCYSLLIGEDALLLVDSEDAISVSCQKGVASKWLPWTHLKMRDGWDVKAELVELARRHKIKKIPMASELLVHLMVRCTESWFLADREALAKFYGVGFNAGRLPSEKRPLESIDKKSVYDGLAAATKDTKTKGKYGKGAHSFSILALIAPQKVVDASPWAKRFVDYLDEVLD